MYKIMKGFKFLDLQIAKVYVNKVSEFRTRMILITTKGNEYAVYRDTHNNIEKVYANWKSDFLIGKEKEDALKLMKIK